MSIGRILVYTLGGIAIAGGIGVGIYFITKKTSVKKAGVDNKENTDDNKTDTTTTDNTQQFQSEIINNGDHLSAGSFPLILGSKNKLVWDIQKALNDKYGAKLVTDGALGEETAKAICSLAFKYCFTAVSDYRHISLQKKNYDDIIAGIKNTDFSGIPTVTTLN